MKPLTKENCQGLGLFLPRLVCLGLFLPRLVCLSQFLPRLVCLGLFLPRLVCLGLFYRGWSVSVSSYRGWSVSVVPTAAGLSRSVAAWLSTGGAMTAVFPGGVGALQLVLPAARCRSIWPVRPHGPISRRGPAGRSSGRR